EDVDKAKEWFNRHGKMAVLICRCVPVVRTLISVPAGFARMPFGSFLLYSAIGTTVWTGLLTCSGYLLGASFKQIGGVLDVAGSIIIGLSVVWYIYRLVKGKRSIHAAGEEQAG
ncbi:MAG: DedA family protein, partial [Bryobacteraceae bacterium]